jgi:phosphate transport system permease protein
MAILKQVIPNNAAQVPKSNLKRRLRLGERFIESGIFIAGALSIIILLGIIIILLKEGLPVFIYTNPWEFLFGTKWYPVSDPPTFGILPFFVSTLMITLIATIISVPIGIACAAYLSEIASPRINDIVKPIIEIMAGIPSVMIGFIGLALLSPLVQSVFNLNTGLCGLTASIMLSLMSL